MKHARIIHLRKSHPSGHEADWFEIETIHGTLTHRSRDRTYSSGEDARAAAVAQGYEVEPGIVEDW